MSTNQKPRGVSMMWTLAVLVPRSRRNTARQTGTTDDEAKRERPSTSGQATRPGSPRTFLP